MRQLPAVRASSEAIPVGHVEYGGGSPESQRPNNFRYDALLVSEPHWRLPNGSWSGGGPFWCEHASLRHTGKIETKPYFFYGVTYGRTVSVGVGPLVTRRVPFPGSEWWSQTVGNTVATARDNLRGLQGDNYAKGITRTKPGQSQASLGVFLSELRDFPRLPGKALLDSLKGVRLKHIVPDIVRRVEEFARSGIGNGLARTASKVSDEYLNWHFGWKPFVSDLRKFYSLSKAIDSALQQLIAENDRNIRRRASLGDNTTVTTDPTWHNTTWNWPVFNCGGADGFPGATGTTHLTAVTRVRTKTWFVAGYRYYIPDTTSWLWKGRAIAHLFGAFPTPRVLWQATPWSWLADWFADLDSLVGYFSPTAVDNLITRYAFTMRRVWTTSEWTASVHLDPVDVPVARWSGADGVLRSLYQTDTLQRGHGWAPFGASLPPPALTSRQVAILAALGITRAVPR